MDLARRRDPVHVARHLEIHKDNIWLMFFYGSYGCCTGIGLGNDLNLGERVQKGANPLTYDLVIIHEKNFDWHKDLSP
jgi:hypothetical protein